MTGYRFDNHAKGLAIILITMTLMLMTISFLTVYNQLDDAQQIANENFEIGAVCLERNAFNGERINVIESTSEEVVVVYAR